MRHIVLLSDLPTPYKDVDILQRTEIAKKYLREKFEFLKSRSSEKWTKNELENVLNLGKLTDYATKQAEGKQREQTRRLEERNANTVALLKQIINLHKEDDPHERIAIKMLVTILSVQIDDIELKNLLKPYLLKNELQYR